MVNKYYQKYKEKLLKKHVIDIKTFLKNKMMKGGKKVSDRYRNLHEKTKQNKKQNKKNKNYVSI